MKIALLGYGKMGKAIATLAEEAGHEIVLKIDRHNADELTPDNLQRAEVAIEFSEPTSAFQNIKHCLEAGVPIVSGTTAWLDRLEEVKKICDQQQGAFFYASNYSIGVHIFFALNRYLAELMRTPTGYRVALEEIHHTQKLDAPSGTAITLAEGILAHHPELKRWVNSTAAAADELPIISKRIDPAAGTHRVAYTSDIDTLTIAHEAHSREGFARGALQAAVWLVGKEGCFGMEDLLGF